MKKLFKTLAFAVFSAALFVLPLAGPTGCAGGPTVSKTSVYKGDSFLFQAEKLQLQAHDLFVAFYRWEKLWRSVLPVSVSRAADFCRLNEEKWMNAINAAHDAYVASPSDANKNALDAALNIVKAELDQLAFYMLEQKKAAPNAGLAPPAVMKELGLAPASGAPQT